MIRIRTVLERGRAHPILGPVVVLLLVFVLAMTFLHGVEDGHASVTDAGVLCIAIVTLLGPALSVGSARLSPLPTPVQRSRPAASPSTWSRPSSGPRSVLLGSTAPSTLTHASPDSRSARRRMLRALP